MITAIARPRPGGVELAAPAPGWWGEPVRLGSRIGPGDPIGTLLVLGRRALVHAPGGARGVVVEAPAGPAGRRAVGFGDLLLVLGEAQAIAEAASASDPAAAATATGLGFRAPSSGRYYRRAAPGKPPFVEVGEVIAPGQVVGLLEVMKTFSRLVLVGDDLPARVRVTRIVPADGDDVEAGALLLELEPTPG